MIYVFPSIGKIYNSMWGMPQKKKKKKWDQRYSLVLGMAFVFNLKFWTFDPFGTIAHEEKNGRNIKPLALLS